jgi:hypothetical protein
VMVCHRPISNLLLLVLVGDRRCPLLVCGSWEHESGNTISLAKGFADVC